VNIYFGNITFELLYLYINFTSSLFDNILQRKIISTFKRQRPKR